MTPLEHDEAPSDTSRAAARLATLGRHTREAISVLDSAGTLLYSTPEARRLLGDADGAVSEVNVLDHLHSDDRAAVVRLMAGEERFDGAPIVALRVADGDGSWRHVEFTWTDVSKDPSVEGSFVVSLRVVAGLHPADVQAPDSLTGLTPRPLFIEEAQRVIARAERVGWQTILLSLDIDHFHVLNDEHGHIAGDVVLATVASRLGASLRQYDTTATGLDVITRVGADEFLLICENVSDEAAALRIAHRIAEVVAQPINLDSATLCVTASIGISMCRGTADATRMISDAEAARRYAKTLGEGRQQFFTTELQERALAATTLIEDLRIGLDQEQFRLVYQPKIALDSNRIVGVEALLRWDHPARGVVPPDEFIPAAESNGLIVALGEWVLREACNEAARWPEPIKVAVNLSPVQFRNRGLVTTVTHALAAARLAPGRLELEITEAVLLQDDEMTVTMLHRLRALGVRVAMDDFGTGYSSLSYLRSFPFDKIKIDRSFIKDIERNRGSAAIIKAIASLGTSLGIRTTAEGVETEEQLEIVRRAGCTEMQGYLVSRPVPACDLPQLIARFRHEAAAA